MLHPSNWAGVGFDVEITIRDEMSLVLIGDVAAGSDLLPAGVRELRHARISRIKIRAGRIGSTRRPAHARGVP